MSGFIPAAQAFSFMNFEQFQEKLRQEGCNHFLVKYLAPNDNSKNQIYLGGGFEALNQIPMTKIERDISVQAGSKKDRFKSLIDFYWLERDGTLSPAHYANLILYPKYPEVRLSGILRGLRKGPMNELVASRDENRILCLGISKEGRVIAWIGKTTHGLGQEIDNAIQAASPEIEGVFHRISIADGAGTGEGIFEKLLGIHGKGWIDSQRLNKHGELLPCRGTNCGGYTLEAELGISPNSLSEPDFDGWELKQFAVRNLDRPRGGAITLMTPEPDGGDYTRLGIVEFVRKYGYPDRRGRIDRLNFGGKHSYGKEATLTKLVLSLPGYDRQTAKLERSDGCMQIADLEGRVAASWSFESLLAHWNRKHARAVYVPSSMRRDPSQQYRYGSKVFVGVGTDFGRFLKSVAGGYVYYDPGIKVEKAQTSQPVHKKRSQIRVGFKNLRKLYKDFEMLDLDPAQRLLNG